MNISNNMVSKNLLWRFAERSGAQIVSFIVSIVLARILTPNDYGTIAIVTIFINILQVFVDSGMGNALIQKKDADDLDFSSVFYFNFVTCLVLYVCMFFTAPFIAAFYHDASLTPVIRVISLTLIISGVKNIQQAYVSRNMMFKRFFYSTLGGTAFSAVVGIVMAHYGFGVWALVAQQLINAAVATLILLLTVNWRPKLIFSWNRLKSLLSFGWKLLVSALLDTLYNNLRQLIIGKMYSATDLAYYSKGDQFPNIVVSNINTSIDSVLLPTMANVQEEKERVKSMTRRSIQTSSYIMWPLMVGMAVCARPLVSLILTDKWLSCVPFIQIFCFSYALWPVHTANLNAIKALGRSDLFLKLEILKKIIGVLSIAISMQFGVLAIAIAYLVTGPISALINAYPNRFLLNYYYKEQIADLLPSVLLACFMGACIWFIQYLPIGSVFILFIQIIVGAFVYIVCSKLLHFEIFYYLLNIIKDIIRKK